MKRAASILIVALACDPGDTTPPQTTSGPSCSTSTASPLVLQLGAEKASAIQQALGSGIALVAFDCNELVVVDSCAIDGRYDFVPRPRIDVERRFTSPAEAEAASPLWGTSTPPLRVEPGEVLSLKLVTVGQLRTSTSVARKDLQQSCANATHFVRAVDVGAFELHGVRGSATHEANAGRVQACPNAGAPSSECLSPLQLHLVPIAP